MSKVSDVIAHYSVERLTGTRVQRFVPLLEVVTLNPRRLDRPPAGDDLVSFVPMKAVEEETGRLNATETRIWSEVRKGYTPFQDGDVIFAKITPCMENGKYALAIGLTGGRAAGSTEFHVLRPGPKLNPKYLLHYLFRSDLRQNARQSMRGAAGQLRVPPSFFAELFISLPSLDEQRRIVAEIEEQLSRLDAGVSALKRVQATLKRYRAAVLAAACAGRLVPTEAHLAREEGCSYETGDQLLARIHEERCTLRADKHKQSSLSDTNDLNGLPEGWIWASTAQLGEVIGGLTKNPKRNSLPLKLPYLRVANVYADELRLDDIEQIGVAESELEKLRLENGDLLVVEGNGSIEQIGRVARWDGSINPCVHQNHLIKIRIAGMNPRWVLFWMLSSAGRRQIESVAASTSGLHTLSTGKVGRLPVPVPPLAEQHRIIAEVDRRLSFVREIEQQVNIDLVRAVRFRQATLRCAFTEALSQGISYE